MKGVSDLIKNEDDRADLTPMIDCVFLLLLFFIVTSSVGEQALFDIMLPKGEKAIVESTENACVVTISAHGNYAIGNTSVSQEELGPFIEDLHGRKPISVIVINGDKRCPYGKIAYAIDIAQGLKVDKISFAVTY
jgi:biopolymer transport protein ExbD